MTAFDIVDLEQRLGFALPIAYRDHIRLHGTGSPIIGTDCAIGDVLSNTDHLPELLTANGVHLHLPEKCVCFMMHQGYIAAWFDAAEGDDPDCWFFSEGTTPTPVNKGPFSAFIETLITAWK